MLNTRCLAKAQKDRPLMKCLPQLGRWLAHAQELDVAAQDRSPERWRTGAVGPNSGAPSLGSGPPSSMLAIFKPLEERLFECYAAGAL